MRMRITTSFLVALSLLPLASAKDKKTVSLPTYFLRARTITVLIEPNAGVKLSDPDANRTARKDVETALLQWGRFDVQIDSSTADLLVVIRRGTEDGVNATLPDPQQNRRPGVITRTNDGIVVGAQRGKPSNAPGQADTPVTGRPKPRLEAGEAEDTFLVYRGQRAGQLEDALDTSPGWRYVAKGALRRNSVPAVQAFREAIANAEKAAAKP